MRLRAREAEEYLWLASDQHMVSSVLHIRHALERGVKVRILTPMELKYPEGYFEQEVVKEYWPVYMSAMNSGQYEDRWLETVDTPMGLSDKQSGRLFFPKIEGDLLQGVHSHRRAFPPLHQRSIQVLLG